MLGDRSGEIAVRGEQLCQQGMAGGVGGIWGYLLVTGGCPGVLLGGNLVLRNEGCLVPVVNQQRLTQLEAMVLPDCYLNLHVPSPIPVM